MEDLRTRFRAALVAGVATAMVLGIGAQRSSAQRRFDLAAAMRAPSGSSRPTRPVRRAAAPAINERAHSNAPEFDLADFTWALQHSGDAGEELPTPDRDEANDGDETDADDQQSSDRSQSGFDQATVRRGQQFFEESCTICHDAERATSKRKTLAGWLATVRRMAAKEDADVPANQHTAIATYLASLNPANQPQADDGGGDGDASEADATTAAIEAAEVSAPAFTLNGTLSTVWRGTDPAVENKGFFPDVWVGFEWRPPESPVSGRVTSCTSCHGTNNGLGVELVEASATIDLIELFTQCPEDDKDSDCAAQLKAGRFIVPFGAFSGRVHPGALRTVSLPLMYNMGRRVGGVMGLQPVLPMPYSDEGVNLHLSKQFGRCNDCSATFDVYGVNGLRTGGPRVFFESRSYRDNNSNVAVGGRATIGDRRLRFGGSVASGELQIEEAPLQNYKLAGADVTLRYEDCLRAYYEYAIRDEDPFPGARALVYGNLIETELLLLSDPKISFLARYDTLDHRGDLGERTTERFTYGLNFVLKGGSLLIVNHEHWIFSDRPEVNIMGLRWTAAF